MKNIITKTVLFSIALTVGNAALAQCSCCQPNTIAETHDHHAAMAEHGHTGNVLTVKEFNELLPPYLQIQKALAADNLADAKAGGATMAEVVAGFSKETSMHLSMASKSIAEAGDIGSAREAFLGISNVLIAASNSTKLLKDSELYLAYCPMAFNNKGGSWLQDESILANPYYGAMMLRCGTIKPLSE